MTRGGQIHDEDQTIGHPPGRQAMRPVAVPAQRPDVDQIPDKIQRLEFMIAQEFEQGVSLAATGAQVHVGDPTGRMKCLQGSGFA